MFAVIVRVDNFQDEINNCVHLFNFEEDAKKWMVRTIKKGPSWRRPDYDNDDEFIDMFHDGLEAWESFHCFKVVDHRSES